MKNTKENREILKAMNSGRFWTAAGRFIESGSLNTPDLLIDRNSIKEYQKDQDLAIEIARRLNDYPNVVRECAAQAKQIRAMKEVLKRIAEWPANSNSEPDVMGDALDEIQRIAAVKR